MNVRRPIRFGSGALLASALLLGGTIPSHAAGEDPSPAPVEQAQQLLVESGIPANALPNETVAWLSEKIESGATISAAVSSQYDNQDPAPAPGTIAPLAYQTAPCYLTVITEYSYSNPRWVDNDSMTACTSGFAASTRHDMQVIKLDTFWGSTSIVASAEHASGGAGTFSSSIRYSCPTSNESGFKADTAGEIIYLNNPYYAEGDSGDWDYYNCG